MKSPRCSGCGTVLQPGNAIRQARCPVEKDRHARCRIDEEADIGQAPDGDDRQVEVPALAGMAQEVGNPPEDAPPTAGSCGGKGFRLLKRIAVHGAVTFLRSTAVRSTVFGVGPATAALRTTRQPHSRGSSSRATGRRWAKVRRHEQGFLPVFLGAGLGQDLGKFSFLGAVHLGHVDHPDDQRGAQDEPVVGGQGGAHHE